MKQKSVKSVTGNTRTSLTREFALGLRAPSPVYPEPPLSTPSSPGCPAWPPPEGGSCILAYTGRNADFEDAMQTRTLRPGLPRGGSPSATSRDYPGTISETLSTRRNTRKNAVFSPTSRTSLGYSGVSSDDLGTPVDRYQITTRDCWYRIHCGK